jgi:nucleoside-diphosphate-sugar epimerase
MRAAITGAFSYTGRHVAERLLAAGHSVVTLTNHPRDTTIAGHPVEAHPLDFSDPARLEQALAGADVLLNTYWIRFSHGGLTFDTAVRNSGVLIDAARSAGVRRLVHVSIANPSPDSPSPYYRGKAAVEELVRASGLPHAIVRPTVIYGHGDVLVNNIAWMVRHSPVFGVPGDGRYGIQPVFIEDCAQLLAEAATASDGSVEVDAVGPDVFEFRELVQTVKRAVGAHCAVVGLPPALALAGSGLFGLLVRDVVLTRSEVEELMAGVLVSREPATCPTSLSSWLGEAAPTLGRTWASELGRHFS